MIFRPRNINLIIVSALLLSGCGPITPWVKPYERQNIADPLMDFSRDPVADAYISHVRDAREGASGADGGAGGGCGCN